MEPNEKTKTQENILRTGIHVQLAPDMNNDGTDSARPASVCTAGQETTNYRPADDCSAGREITKDRIEKITSKYGGCAPAEIRIRGHIQHPSRVDGNEVEAILDLGAGKSYILLGKDFNFIPTEQLQGNLEVLFADGSTCHITETVTVNLMVLAVDGETEFRRNRVTLYVIRTPEAPDTEEPLRLLLGRNLMLEFKLDVYSARRAMIGRTLLYEENTDNHESVNTRTGEVTQNERLNWIRNMIHIDHLEGMPRALIDDAYEEDDDELTAEDITDICDRASKDQGEVTVRVGEPEDGAPWGRLHVAIPWLNEGRPGRNFKLAWLRDSVTSRRLNSTQATLYSEAIAVLTDGGFAQWSAKSRHQDKHYIACRPLFKENRTSTRCRICLDAREINRYTGTGNILSPPVLDCLLRFRVVQWVALYDLEKAFWQVKLEDEDIGWYTTVVSGEQLQFTRMIFGANYSPSGLETAVRLVDKKARDWLATNSPSSRDEPPRPRLSFEYHNYVDDFCHRHQTDRDALLTEATWFRWFLTRYGFPSSKFMSNAEDRTEPTTQGYLGYNWTLPSDTIEVRIPQPSLPSARCTTTDVVAIVAKLFDPLGLALKEQLHGRMIIRAAFEATKSNKETKAWQREVPDDIVAELKTWINGLKTISSLTSRFVGCETLNVFSDASQTCWAYEVRGTNFELIASRGGLTAARATIPRNELIALHEAVRDIEGFVVSSNPKRIYFYADSQCTVWRIRNSNKTPSFETKRLKNIRETLLRLPVKADVIHLPGDLNLADYPTRPRAKGPRQEMDKEMLLKYQQDPTIPRVTQAVLAGRDLEHFENLVSEWITEEKEDTVNLMQLRQRKPRNNQQPDTQPSTHHEDHQDHEVFEDIGTEMIQRKKRIMESQDKYITIDERVKPDVTIDSSGLLRKGDKVIIPEEDADLVKEILDRIHGRGHPGITQTRNLVKKDYWVKNLNKHVKRYVTNCQVCVHARGHRAIRAVAGDALRMKEIETIPTAAIVGIDIATVQAVEEGEPSCFITAVCALTKWTRVEPLEGQSAEEIVSGLERIFNRTLYPLVLVMDNAASFRSKRMKRFAIRHGIRLGYSPAYASAYCGWIERAHQSILSMLRVLQQREPLRHWSELLPEAEYLTNSRPLSEDSELSPLHLVFSASTITDPERPAPNIEDLVEVAGVAHLLTPTSGEFTAYKERVVVKHRKLLRAYEGIYNKRRNNIRQRLLRKIRDGSESFPVGTFVHVYRPVACKTRSQWSEPRKIVGSESPSIRVVERSDGQRSTEWIANLRPAGSVP